MNFKIVNCQLKYSGSTQSTKSHLQETHGINFGNDDNEDKNKQDHSSDQLVMTNSAKSQKKLDYFNLLILQFVITSFAI